MTVRTRFPKPEESLRTKVKIYKETVREIRNYLDHHSHEWGRFQSEFNQEVNAIFRDLIIFEKEHLDKGEEEKVYKLKRLFVDRFRDDFVKGDYLRWSLEKPCGYAGDYKIIDDIYQNSPRTVGFERLYDNYFQMSSISVAVRNRKEDFKRMICEFIKEQGSRPLKIMDLASGPCRDIFELIRHPLVEKGKISFHCYDADPNALEYASKLLKEDPRVQFFKQNAVRIALKKDPENSMESGYDLIFSTGLFDYLDYRVSVRLISNLKRLLNPGGKLIISDVRDKFSNPSIYFMEWVADWSLIYRDDDNFRNIFVDAGFPMESQAYRYEQQGVMQYILAVK